jgi:hypothetical protein
MLRRVWYPNHIEKGQRPFTDINGHNWPPINQTVINTTMDISICSDCYVQMNDTVRTGSSGAKQTWRPHPLEYPDKSFSTFRDSFVVIEWTHLSGVGKLINAIWDPEREDCWGQGHWLVGIVWSVRKGPTDARLCVGFWSKSSLFKPSNHESLVQSPLEACNTRLSIS